MPFIHFLPHLPSQRLLAESGDFYIVAVPTYQLQHPILGSDSLRKPRDQPDDFRLRQVAHEYRCLLVNEALELSEDERLCYEHEYGIADSGVLEVTRRRALMTYVEQELFERRCWRRNGESVPIWTEAVAAGRGTAETGQCNPASL